jgi:hypothetical protein
MHTSTNAQEAAALLLAAERSLFDATSRLEQALAALGGGDPEPGQLDQVRLYAKLIQMRLNRAVTSKAA